MAWRRRQAMGTPSNWERHSIKWERPVTGNAITLNGNAITLDFRKRRGGLGWSFVLGSAFLEDPLNKVFQNHSHEICLEKFVFHVFFIVFQRIFAWFSIVFHGFRMVFLCVLMVFSKNWISKNWKSIDIHWCTPPVTTNGFPSMNINGFPSMNINGFPSTNSWMVHQWIWSPFFGSLSLGPFLWHRTLRIVTELVF